MYANCIYDIEAIDWMKNKSAKGAGVYLTLAEVTG